MKSSRAILVLSMLLLLASEALTQSDSMIEKLWDDPTVISRTESTIIAPAQQPILLPPSGDLKLKRCKASQIKLHDLQAGDSIYIQLATKNGKPLKSIALTNSSQTPLHPPFTGSAYDYSIPLQQEDQLTLRLKAPFSLKKRSVQLQLQRFPAITADTIFTRYDTLYRSTVSGFVDTLYRTLVGDGTTFEVQDQQLKLYSPSGQLVKEERTLKHRTQQTPRKILLPRGTQRLSRLGKTKLSYTDFGPGDTLLIAIDALGKQPIASYTALDEQGQQLAGAIAEMMIRDTLIIKQEKQIDIILKGKPGLSRQLTKVEVSVIRPATITSYYEQTDSIFQIKERTFYDTILYTVADVVSSISPLRNMESEPYRAIDIKMPLTLSGKETFLFMAFWIGTSSPAIQAYNTLETEVPPDWVQPGVPLAVGAYGLAKKVVLPGLTTEDVDFSIINLRQKQLLEKGKTRVGAIYRFVGSNPNFGILRANDLQGSLREKDEISKMQRRRFFLWFSNKNSINTYPLAIKMVGFYRYPIGTEKVTTFLTTRTSEIPKA